MVFFYIYIREHFLWLVIQSAKLQRLHPPLPRKTFKRKIHSPGGLSWLRIANTFLGWRWIYSITGNTQFLGLVSFCWPSMLIAEVGQYFVVLKSSLSLMSCKLMPIVTHVSHIYKPVVWLRQFQFTISSAVFPKFQKIDCFSFWTVQKFCSTVPRWSLKVSAQNWLSWPLSDWLMK